MRPLHAILLVAVLSIGTSARADDYDLYLYGSDGSYTSLDVANLRSLSFSQQREYNADSVRIYVNRVHANFDDGTSVSYDLSGYESILFAPVATSISAVTTTPSAPQILTASNGRLTANADGQLRIVALDGRLLSQIEVRAGESLSLTSMPAGIYIVHLSGQSIKIRIQ